MAPPPAPLAALLAAPLAALLAAPLAVLLAAPPPAWHPQGGRSSLPGQSNVRDFSVSILEIGFSQLCNIWLGMGVLEGLRVGCMMMHEAGMQEGGEGGGAPHN